MLLWSTAALTLLVTVAVGPLSSESVGAATASRIVPLGTLYQASALTGRPVVQVRLGDSKLVPLLLDTGSVGLVVVGSGLPRGILSSLKWSKQKTSETFGEPVSGSQWNGRIARSEVSIG